MIDRRHSRATRRVTLSAGTVAVGAMTAGYHEVLYDDGDQYKGEWNAEGKVGGGACTAILAAPFLAGSPFAHALTFSLSRSNFPTRTLLSLRRSWVGGMRTRPLHSRLVQYSTRPDCSCRRHVHRTWP
jgi:hypothetical protein